MLGSITPLGERARNARWGWTAAWFSAGAVGGGAILGAVLGAAGAPLVALLPAPAPVTLLVVGVVAGALLAAEVGGGGSHRLPSPARQVDEQWLRRYRPWVYGAGFGFQLGIGIVTVISSSAFHAALAAALLSGSAGGGAIVLGAFGAVRAASLAPAALVRTPLHLVRVDGALRRLEGPVARASLTAHGAIVLVAVALAGVIR
jgi:hypothetical protein